jgi:tetratricopeptide (TPR) repeat protein
LSVARLASAETFEQVMRWLDNATSDLPAYCVQGQIAMVREHGQHCWQLLLTCSLFDQPSGVSREVLEVITGVSLRERDDSLTVLQRLSLLSRTDADRFFMLPMVQGYTGLELTSDESGQAIIEAWLRWLMKFGKQYGNRLDLHIEHVHTVETEYGSLLSAIRWCRAHARWDVLLQLAEDIWFYPYLVGLLGEVREILDAALLAARIMQDERREGRFLRRLALTFWVQEEYDSSLHNGLQRAREIAEYHQDYRELGRVYHTYSDVLAHQGKAHKGERLAREMLKIGKACNYVKLKALAVYRLSEFASRQGRFDKALDLLSKGENWCKETGWQRCLAWNKYLRGVTLIRLGAMAEAEPFLKESLEMASSWRERKLIANNASGLAQVYRSTGAEQLAQQMSDLSADLYERLGAIKHVFPPE